MIITKIFQTITVSATAFALVGCAAFRVKHERVGLGENTINKTDLILVKEISADRAHFTGDKSAEEARVTGEKSQIKSQLSDEIVTNLKDRGFNAKLASAGGAGAFVIEGAVTEFDHGSAAGRLFGAGGSSTMTADLKIIKGKTTVADIEVQGVSEGTGFTAMGSYLKPLMKNIATQTAKYISTRLK